MSLSSHGNTMPGTLGLGFLCLLLLLLLLLLFWIFGSKRIVQSKSSPEYLRDSRGAEARK
jgi:hypothetical protein